MDITKNTSVIDLAKHVLEGTGMFLVDSEIKGTSGTNIWLFVDTVEGGVSIDDCAKVSREIIFLIESHNVIEGKFTLNVSSPGLDRPLKDERQFVKNIGRNASVKFTSDDKTEVLKGKLEAVDAEFITIKADKGQKHQLKREDVIETKILPAF
jgi:ribosome maturation factor RimP